MRSIVCVIALLIAAQQTGFSAEADQTELARTILEEGMRDKNPDVRKEATLAAGLIGTNEKTAALAAEMLRDSDVQVRLAAVATITDLRRRGAIPDLKRALQDPVPEVAFAAAKALYNLKDPSGREVLLAVLEGEKSAKSNPLRAHFREMVRMFHTPRSAALLAVRQGIGFVPVPGLGEGFGALQGLLFSNNLSPRASVALLLVSDRSAETRQALLDALGDSDGSVRAAAAQAIALRNDPKLRSSLVTGLSDEDHRVRYRAAAGYLRLTELSKSHSTVRRKRG